MKTSSAKAKGRRGQDLVRDALRKIGAAFGLEEDDIKSAQMGASGVDIVFSPAARKLFPWSCEVKVVESLNVMSEFKNHHAQYAHLPTTKFLFHMKNKSPMLVTMTFEDFAKLYEEYLHHQHKPKEITAS